MNIQIIALLIDLLVALLVSLAVLSRPQTPGGRSLTLLALFAGIWSLCDVLLPRPALVRFYPFLAAAIYLSSVLAASAQFIYMIWHSNRQHWISRLPVWLLAILPLATQVIFWVAPLHTALFGRTQPQAASALFLGNVWGKVNALYMFCLVGVGALFLWNAFLERPRRLFMPFGIVLLASLIPPAAATLEFTGLSPLPQTELLPLGFAIAAVAYAVYFFQRRAAITASIDRNAVVEGMDDGWMVLDGDNIVVDMNAAAERMAGLSRRQVLGRPVTAMLGGLPDLGQAFQRTQELEMKRSIRSEEGWKYLNIRISTLTDHGRKPFGKLALWHDVTERKLTEDARQRAHDEMLVLLNAIASAASDALDLEEFLSESIYHIIYPFRSQVVAFFLHDESPEKKGGARYVLAAHLGLPADSAAQLATVNVSSPLLASVAALRQPVQVKDVDEDGDVPPGLRGMGLACLLALPLISQSGENTQVLGCMCLARKEGPAYSQDDIVRLTMMSDQIASLIYSDRRRKLAITSGERKRLMRDLHDSVSQKLYGLVTTTEAAQAAIEAGSLVDPSEVLVRIGENARQAVKEMRLFLFQMQPIDMEKDGLISLLHHRLAAVEGRANIKANFRADLADDEVALSTQTEIVLYYIAQEALNNVLRHAAAKSISVTLKQGRRNVILEIRDDGCGFDIKKVERGGLGLTNMRERAAQIHSKLRILSKPDQGTRVVITVPRDPSVKPVKHRR